LEDHLSENGFIKKIRINLCQMTNLWFLGLYDKQDEETEKDAADEEMW